jgi:ectoine hydroxylase-related dioxygenase (phytanoyl-CoA dioxygenase family)
VQLRYPAAMAGIANDGYVVVRGVLDAERVEALSAAIDRAVAAGSGVEIRVGTVWIRDATSIGEPVTSLGAEDGVLAAVSQLLGPRPVLTGALMRNPVGTSAQQGLHVDWAGPIAPGHDQQVQAMFFVDDVRADNGPPRLVPGTHRCGSIPPKNLADPHARHRDECCVTGPAGDVLVFSSHLWHSGTGNASGRPRRVVTLTFRREPRVA